VAITAKKWAKPCPVTGLVDCTERSCELHYMDAPVRVADQVFPIAEGESLPDGNTRANTRARPTGEFRYPKSGEWFLSGAIVEAYRAPNDLTMGYHIARLVQGRMVWDQ
jgi:hypothetical protein